MGSNDDAFAKDPDVIAITYEVEAANRYEAPPKDTKLVLRSLVDQGWKTTYAALFGSGFVEALAKHHEEAIEWHWDSRISLIEGKTPDYWAYFPIWSRGHLKSTIARRIAVIEAVLSFTFDQPAYILYVSRNSSMAKKHALSIETLLTNPRVRQYCPQLSAVKRNVQGSSRGWQATFLNTEAGVYHFGGLDEGMAGGNVDDVRPTAIFLDDIDGREDSPVVADSRFTKLTTEVLPMRQGNTLVFFPQNFISRYSTQYRIHSGQARVLTNRKPTEPIPAILDLETDQRTVGGIIQDIIVNGTPTWHKYGIDRCQEEINTIGLEAFKRECHPAGTRVRSGWNRNTPIEQVRIGDYVLTHKNRLKSVSELIRREYSGNLYRFKIANASVPLLTTANHPLLAAVPPANWRWQGKKRDPATIEVKWHKASDLKKGAYLLEPLPTSPPVSQDGLKVWEFTDADCGRPAKGNRVITATPALFRLLGYYLAEGGVNGSVSLTFHENEKEYIDDVLNLFPEVFGVPAQASPDNGHSVRIQCGAAIPKAFFQDVGVGSHFKSVPDWVFASSNNLIKELIIGYWRGDGCKDPSGFAYNTVSERLAEHIRLLLLRFGIIAGLYRLKERDVLLPQKTWYRRSRHWQGDINGGHATKMGELVGMPHMSTGQRGGSCFIHGGYVWKPIRSITTEAVENYPVFNFEVEDDESFVAENVVSHNCQHLVAESREGLILHAYNDDVHVISESEFGAVYGHPDAWKEFYKVPFNDWARTKTEKHANVGGYMAVSSQNSRLPGMTFCIPLSFPAETMPEDFAERMLSILTPYAYGENGTSVTWKKLIRDVHLRANAGEHFDTLAKRVDYERSHLKAVIPKYSRPILKRYNVKIGAMSHSEDTVRTIFNDIFGFNFQPANPHKLDCIEEINGAFKVDWNENHPFRPNKGYSRTFIIAPDNVNADPRMENGKAIYPPVPYPKEMQPHELHDSQLIRFQFCNLRYAAPKLTQTGERIDEMLKLNDDFFQGWQMVWFKNLLANIRLDKGELEELSIAPKFRLDAINAQKGEISEQEYGQQLITRQAKLVIPKILSGAGKPKGKFSKFKR